MTLFEIALVVFGISVVEEVLFVLPSTGTAVASGLLISNLGFSLESFILFFLYIIVPLSLGMAIGSTVWFLVVKYSISSIENRFNYFNKTIKHARTLVKNNPHSISWFYFSLRATPIFSGLVATFIGGLLNISVLKHLVITFFGTIIRGGILAFIGWQIGELFVKYYKVYGWLVLFFTILISSIVSFYIFYKKKL